MFEYILLKPYYFHLLLKVMFSQACGIPSVNRGEEGSVQGGSAQGGSASTGDLHPGVVCTQESASRGCLPRVLP